ncbi:MAG: gliding motility lipoprotein GldB [Bacteroidia bacterium]|nr:gliding motility lipoprotein GldB [Bacteroidia bacterium]
MLSKLSPIAFFVVMLWLSGCDRAEEDQCVFSPDTQNIQINMEITPLQDSLQFASKQAMVDFLGRHPALRDAFLHRGEYPNDSVFINELYHRFAHPAFDSLLQETHRVFGDGAQLRDEFAKAFTNLKYYYPELPTPRVQTMVSGLDHDLFVSDTLIIVGLDYYLGPTGKYRPKMYDYLLRQYQPETIVPSIMLLYGIGPSVNKTTPEDKTALADMMAYGKSYYFAKHMLPCLPDSTLIWYTPDEVKAPRKPGPDLGKAHTRRSAVHHQQPDEAALPG